MGKFQPIVDYVAPIYRQDRPVFFLLVLFCAIFAAFFFMDTDMHRNVFYVSLPLCAYLIHKNKLYLKEFFLTHKLLVIPAFVYLLYIFASLFWSDVTEQGREFDKGKILLFLLLSMTGLFLVAQRMEQAYSWLVYTFVFSAFFSSVYLLGHHLSYSIGMDRWMRLEGLGRAENSVMAGYLYATAILAIMYARPLAKIAWQYRLVMAAFLFGIMLLSLSRGPILAFGASVGTLMLFKKQYKRLAFLGVIAILSVGAVLYTGSRENIPIANRGDTGRTQVWNKAVDLIAERPVFGYGIGSKFLYPYSNAGYRIEFASHPHSFYLATLVQGGIVSLVFLFWIMATMFFKSLSLLRTSGEGWPLAVFVSFAALGFIDFGGVYVNLGVVWVAFWYQYALIMARENPHPVV